MILTQRDEARLSGVHPNLFRVIRRAAEMAGPGEEFFILEGVRSREQMMINYGKGRTAAQLAAKGIPASYAKPREAKVTWLSNPFNSKHARQADGWGHAFDAAPIPLNWNDRAKFQAMAELFMRAAAAEKVRIRWGRDWNMNGKYEEKGETDGPHFELVL